MRPWNVLRASTETLRSAAQAAVHKYSLRSVAARIGMSPPGLQHFLAGGSPLRPTLRKLVMWYGSHGRSAGDDVEEGIRAAVALLLTYLPPMQQHQAEQEIMQVVERYAPAVTEALREPTEASPP